MNFKLLILLIFVSLTSCVKSASTEQKIEKEIIDTMEKSTKTLEELDTPIFWAEGHPRTLRRESWTLEVTGACENPTTFTWQDLMDMPKTVSDARLSSVTRWSVKGDWGGVKVSEILERVGAKESVKYVRFWSHDLIYDTSIPIDIALKERTLVAWEFNGNYLTEDYGGPIRGFVPCLWGYKSAKSIVKIELMEYYIPGYWEKRGYTDKGLIEPGPMRDVNDDFEMKQIPPGEVKGFIEE
ncbi:MAG: molybdopterin-dependent oxidoreductase [Candidatus Zophobacter franzmannii]|nr:molybdopterin-dependent oxidoreductase [Candidatus Zophobacter franzmannii]